IASEGARATVAAMRFDRDMPQGTTPKDLTELSQQYSRVMAAPSLEDRLAAAQQVVQNLQQQVERQNAARAFGGLAPAGSKPAQPAVTGQQTGERGTQPSTNLKKPDQGHQR